LNTKLLIAPRAGRPLTPFHPGAIDVVLHQGPESAPPAASPGSFRMPSTHSPLPTDGKTCGDFAWTDVNYRLNGNCGGFFEVDYAAHNATAGETTDNVALTVGPWAR
jgi:hypothetical protein